MKPILLCSLVLLAVANVCAEEARKPAIEQLTALVSESIGSGEKPGAWLEVYGERKAWKISEASTRGLTVSLEGNPLLVAWDKIAPKDLAGIAKSVAGEKGERLLVAGQIALELNQVELGQNLLAQAMRSNPALRDKAQALMGTAAEKPMPSTSPTKGDKSNPKAGAPVVAVQGPAAEFTVEEVAGVDRPAWPVLFGMPFAPGQLKSSDSIAVCTAAGKAVPQEHRVVAQWGDGSVKWMHVDCQLDLSKSSKETFKVVYGQAAAPSVKPAGELKLKKDGESVSVETGAIAFTLSPSGGGVPENVRLAGGELISKGGTHSLSFVESGPPVNTPELRGNWKRPIPDGLTPVELSALANKAEVSVEQQDALSATVLVRGWYEAAGRKACKFDVRVTAFAGKPYLKIQHTLIYTEDPGQVLCLRIELRIQFRRRAEGAVRRRRQRLDRCQSGEGLLSARAGAGDQSQRHQDRRRAEEIHCVRYFRRRHQD